MAKGTLDTRAIWAIAIPAMVTNVATAMIGIGDVWIVGRLGDAAAQGAVDVGARLFALLFTVMNFLKTGTTGLVAQAGTRAGADAQAQILLRGLAVGLAIAAALLLLRPLLLPAVLTALGAEGRVYEAAATYAGIRYWSAPAVMANFALVGFLVGQRRMTTVLVVEVAYNLLNVALGLWFVLGLDMSIAGIGWSSFIAELAKLALVAVLVLRGGELARVTRLSRETAILSRASLAPFLSLNRDLFLRTLLLVLAMAALTRIGAERGPVVLAANAILFQLFIFSALLLDGFENAAQVLNGERAGAYDRVGFERFARAILLRGIAVAAVVAAVFGVFGAAIIESFAATPPVAMAAQLQLPWLVMLPFAGVASFIYDGVFVGASWTLALLLTMLGGVLVYAAALALTWHLGNGGLWMSFVIFLAARALFQRLALPRLVARLDEDPTLSPA